MTDETCCSKFRNASPFIQGVILLGAGTVCVSIHLGTPGIILCGGGGYVLGMLYREKFPKIKKEGHLQML